MKTIETSFWTTDDLAIVRALEAKKRKEKEGGPGSGRYPAGSGEHPHPVGSVRTHPTLGRVKVTKHNDDSSINVKNIHTQKNYTLDSGSAGNLKAD